MTDALIKTLPSNGRMGHEIKVQGVKRTRGMQFTVTIPQPIAEAMGFKKGDLVDMTIEDGSIKLRKKKALK
jgi:AbrB family looped-hinge helix DNA binding protein